MTHPAYPAARAAALRVHSHFAAQTAELLPNVATMEAIIDVAFWASLRREEIYTPKISLAFAAPDQVDMSLAFERPVPFAPQPLTRLGPAVERPGIHLCISQRDGELVVWGATRVLPDFCFVLEVVAPALLVVKQSRGDDSGKFLNVAVLQGEEIKVVDQAAASEFDSGDSVKVLTQLAVSMRAHGRGGTLLVVPAAQPPRWRDSILQPIIYSVVPAFAALVKLMHEDSLERERRRWQEALRRVIDGIAGVTAVDGAAVISDRYELLAFGAKIVRPRGADQVDRVLVTSPIEGASPIVSEPGELGGTRHLSAAQFAHDQRDTLALVASQDGRFTVFSWSAQAQMVHGNRVESLLL